MVKQPTHNRSSTGSIPVWPTITEQRQLLVNPEIGSGVKFGSSPEGLIGIHDRDTAKVRNATYFRLVSIMVHYSGLSIRLWEFDSPTSRQFLPM